MKKIEQSEDESGWGARMTSLCVYFIRLNVRMWKTIGKLTTKRTHEIMSRSKFVFRVRDVIRFVMRKSSLNCMNIHSILMHSNKKENE